MPRFPFRMLHEPGSLIVSRAFRLVVPAATARPADLGAAVATPTLPTASFAAHVLWPHQLAAPARRANKAASAGVLHKLFVPLLLEAGIKQQANEFSGDIISSAASWRHVLLWIGDGQFEDFAETRMAHAMAALELGRLAHGGIAVPAKHTLGNPKAEVRTRTGRSVGGRALTGRRVSPSVKGGQRAWQGQGRRSSVSWRSPSCRTRRHGPS